MSRTFQVKAVPSRWLENNGRRLDCGPYVSGAIEARELLQRFTTSTLKEVVAGHDGGIYNGPQFVRNYVEDSQFGVPFLTTSSLLQADLSLVSHLSKRDAESSKLRDLKVVEGMTLITCSGTIGKMTYARKDMEGMWSNQDIMKVVPNRECISPGYLFAFLSSRYGLPLVLNGTYGAIIQHIEPQHISDLPVPRLARIEDQVHELVQRAANLRTGASQQLSRATKAIISELGQPTKRDTYSIAQIVTSSEILKTMRMEGFFFNQRGREADAWVTTHQHGFWTLGDVADVYDVPLFKHIYVESEHGIPFFTSGELFKLDRKPEKYLSTTQTKDLDKYVLGQNWVLLARSGQLGGIICRPQFSDSSMEGATTSDHVIRIISKGQDVPPGYIYAYLSTQEIGYPLLMRTSSGTSIPALWPTYLKSIPIVRAPITFMEMVDAEVKGAFEMRVEATRFEDEARAIVERAIEEGGR